MQRRVEVFSALSPVCRCFFIRHTGGVCVLLSGCEAAAGLGSNIMSSSVTESQLRTAAPVALSFTTEITRLDDDSTTTRGERTRHLKDVSSVTSAQFKSQAAGPGPGPGRLPLVSVWTLRSTSLSEWWRLRWEFPASGLRSKSLQRTSSVLKSDRVSASSWTLRSFSLWSVCLRSSRIWIWSWVNVLSRSMASRFSGVCPWQRIQRRLHRCWGQNVSARQQTYQLKQQSLMWFWFFLYGVTFLLFTFGSSSFD